MNINKFYVNWLNMWNGVQTHHIEVENKPILTEPITIKLDSKWRMASHMNDRSKKVLYASKLLALDLQ